MEGNPDLIQFIAREITRQGPVSFAWFMEQALYHPEYGYYASGRSRVGREGDFFTNVSVGPLFGRLMALQFQEMWEQLGRPVPFTIVEQGANTGDFAADLLQSLRGMCERGESPLFEVLEYRIVEPFPALRTLQAQRIKERLGEAFEQKPAAPAREWTGKKPGRSSESPEGPVGAIEEPTGDCLGERQQLPPPPLLQWSESLEELEPFCGVHFSNELLDALPVHLLRCFEGSWRERHVDLDLGTERGTGTGRGMLRETGLENPRFVFVDRPVGSEEIAALIPFDPSQLAQQAQQAGLASSSPSLYQTEVNPAALRWLDQVAEKLLRGFILTIDYGYPRESYYHPDRSTGTLTCYSKHQQNCTPLEQVGQADITAHVEFTSLIERGLLRGLSLCGFTDQHRYMVGLAAPILGELDPKELRAFRTLMHPSFMGGAFKVLALEKATRASLRGFGQG